MCAMRATSWQLDKEAINLGKTTREGEEDGEGLEEEVALWAFSP